MATSPSDPDPAPDPAAAGGLPAADPDPAADPAAAGAVPPEVIALAVALAAIMFEPGADGLPAPPDTSDWRWEAWDSPSPPP